MKAFFPSAVCFPFPSAAECRPHSILIDGERKGLVKNDWAVCGFHACVLRLVLGQVVQASRGGSERF